MVVAAYSVQLSDEFVATVDLPPGVPGFTGVAFNFLANTADELRELVPLLGFDAARLDETETLHARCEVPITRDGEQVDVGASVYLWLGARLATPRSAFTAPTALKAAAAETAGGA